MNSKLYSKRVWLNKDSSPSTGSLVAYHGPMIFKKSEEETAFLEIADCCGKIRLHVSPMDTIPEFIEKMVLIRDSLDDFIDHLKITVD